MLRARAYQFQPIDNKQFFTIVSRFVAEGGV